MVTEEGDGGMEMSHVYQISNQKTLLWAPQLGPISFNWVFQ